MRSTQPLGYASSRTRIANLQMSKDRSLHAFALSLLLGLTGCHGERASPTPTPQPAAAVRAAAMTPRVVTPNTFAKSLPDASLFAAATQGDLQTLTTVLLPSVDVDAVNAQGGT